MSGERAEPLPSVNNTPMAKKRIPPTGKRPSSSTRPQEPPKTPEAARKAKAHTVVWGKLNEADDFLIAPRAVLYLGRYDPELSEMLRPRHLLLLLVLAAKKFLNKPIRLYWQELAETLGEKPDTVRKWAYQLRDMKLLRIRQFRGRDPKTNKPGIRNERNLFDIEPFVKRLETAFRLRRQERFKLKRLREANRQGDADE